MDCLPVRMRMRQTHAAAANHWMRAHTLLLLSVNGTFCGCGVVSWRTFTYGVLCRCSLSARSLAAEAAAAHAFCAVSQTNKQTVRSRALSANNHDEFQAV
jgi:hypothetical protein